VMRGEWSGFEPSKVEAGEERRQEVVRRRREAKVAREDGDKLQGNRPRERGRWRLTSRRARRPVRARRRWDGCGGVAAWRGGGVRIYLDDGARLTTTERCLGASSS